MLLNVPTLLAGMAAAEFAACVFLAFFLLCWRPCETRCFSGLATWCAGLFLAAAGTYLLAMRGALPDFLSIVVANALILLGVGLRSVGFANFLMRPRNTVVFLSAPAVWVFLCLFPEFLNVPLLRVNYVQTCVILSGLWIVWLALFDNREGLVTARMLAAAVMVESVGFFWFMSAHNVDLSDTFMAANAGAFGNWQLLVILAGIIVGTVLPSCMVLERSLLTYKRLATKDPLTGLSNKSAFISEAKRQLGGDGVCFHMIMFEIESLDRVRTKFGCAMEDALVRLFAQVLKNALGGRAVLGRVSENKFTVLVNGQTHEDALLIVKRVRHLFAGQVKIAAGGKLNVSVHGGVAPCEPNKHLENAIELSETALRRAKKKKTGRTAVLAQTEEKQLAQSDNKSSFRPTRKSAA